MKKQLTIGIASWEGGQAKRDLIMETWGQDAVNHPEVDLVMFVGNPELSLPVRDGLMLYLPCPDNYMSLPQKVRWFCLWALAETYTPWLFKCPDDIYIRVDRLVQLSKRDWHGALMVGCRGARGMAANLQGGAGFLISRSGAIAIGVHCTKEWGADDRQVRIALTNCRTRFRHCDLLYYRSTGKPLPDNEMAACHLHAWSAAKLKRLHRKFK